VAVDLVSALSKSGVFALFIFWGFDDDYRSLNEEVVRDFPPLKLSTSSPIFRLLLLLLLPITSE